MDRQIPMHSCRTAVSIRSFLGLAFYAALLCSADSKGMVKCLYRVLAEHDRKYGLVDPPLVY